MSAPEHRPITGRTPEPTMPPTGRHRPGGTRRARHPDDPVSRPRSVIRRASTGIATFIGVTVVVSGLAMALLYYRLERGPIALDWLKPSIEAGLKSELSGLGVSIAGVSIARARDGGIELRLDQLRVSEAVDKPVAEAPIAALRLSYGAMLHGRLTPERITLLNPRVLLAYDQDGGLRFSVASEPERPRPLTDPAGLPPAQVRTSTHVRPPESVNPALKVDLARTISEAAGRARRGEHSASFLKSIGIRDAVILFDQDGRQSTWNVPSAYVSLSHGSTRTAIRGQAEITTTGGGWSFDFVIDESEQAGRLSLRSKVRDLVPSTLAGAFPPLAFLGGLEAPVSGEFVAHLGLDGVVRIANLAADMGKGLIRLPWLADTPFQVDRGLIRLAYRGDTNTIELLPSQLHWGKSYASVSGRASKVRMGTAAHTWLFEAKTDSGSLSAEEFAIVDVPLKRGIMSGVFNSARGDLQLTRFELGVADATISLAGSVTDLAGSPQGVLEGNIGAMPLSTLKVLWPRSLAPRLRDIVGQRVAGGRIVKGAFRAFAGSTGRAAGGDAGKGILSLEAEGLQIPIVDGMQPLGLARVLVQLKDDNLEVVVPEGRLQLSGKKNVHLTSGRFNMAEVSSGRPLAIATIKVKTDADSALEIIHKHPATRRFLASPAPSGIDGNVTADIRFAGPVDGASESNATKLAASIVVTNGRMRKAAGLYDIADATLRIDVSEVGLEAKGDLTVQGIPAKLSWQDTFNVPVAGTSPIRVTARLDDAARDQLGLSIEDVLHGVTPVEVEIVSGSSKDPKITVRVSLTDAELRLDEIAWQKRPGSPATLEFAVNKGKAHAFELQNMRLSGETIGLEGWVGLDASGRPREYYFPIFNVNLVSRLEVRGKLGSDGVWRVAATGKTFNGQDFFRSLYNFNAPPSRSGGRRHSRSKGIDLTARIETVIGFSELSMKALEMRLMKSGNKLVYLDGKGRLPDGSPLAFKLVNETGQPRRLRATSSNAGLAFKLVGFYPNLDGGEGILDVNLDGQGVADTQGVLVVRRFSILGDPVVAELVSSADDGRPAIGAGRGARQRIVRERFKFERIYVPFSIGQGQFVLDHSYIKGPVMGATLRGKVDFAAQRISLGGTYVPLQELNAALGQIPILGQLLTGPRGEGIWGITFAIQGRLADPQVIVHPLSMVAPGILREIFQLTDGNPRIAPRSVGPGSERAAGSQPQGRAWSTQSREGASRAISSDRPGAVLGQSEGEVAPRIIDGWQTRTRERN